MTLATKTLATIMLIAMLTIQTSPLSALSQEGNSSSTGHRQEKQLERLYRRHDRKLELRSSVLGIGVDELKDRLKNETFDQITKKAGFKNKEAFHTALVGKLKNELRERGWTDSRIQKFVSAKLQKYTATS